MIRSGTSTNTCAGSIGTSAARISGLAARTILPDELLVHGARALLEYLHARGLSLYLASGTDLFAVQREAELLDVTRYFDGHIYGALDDYRRFSKKMVIDRILREHAISGPAARLVRRRVRRD